MTPSEKEKIEIMSPQEIRMVIRGGGWDRSTAGLAVGYAQANLPFSGLAAGPRRQW